MCTVTFLPSSTGFYLTSNRDEHQSRSQAEIPKRYKFRDCELIFPRDPDKSGSWFAQKGNGDVAVLLNGAFVSHVKTPPYRKSRGLLLLEILSHQEPDVCFDRTDLTRVEPFTLIIFTRGMLHECRWDGADKHYALPDPSIPHLWASATLYSETELKQRQRWFSLWHQTVLNLSIDKILDFHRFAGTGNQQNDLVINRPNEFMATVSITSLIWTRVQSIMVYQDLKEKDPNTNVLISNIVFDDIDPITPDFPLKAADKSEDCFNLKPDFLMRCASRFKRFSIRMFNWEYWPLELVYLPVLPYWFWLSLKARSLFFFSAANPLIHNAGFAMSRKSRIYDLMPEKYYPKTLLCEREESLQSITAKLKVKGLGFPLIAKPDMGERGVKVQLLRTETDFKAYLEHSKFDFLIQEYIDLEQEIGIFYYRFPGETKGHISGIVGKEFIAVTGDGVSTIEMLLIQEDRYFLQLTHLRAVYGKVLATVLPHGAYYKLLPYGNHSRGAKFIDLSCRINEDLRDAIDQICQDIPEFYYGRLDLKFNNWEELRRGENFSVIEVNGAASEPTHIYDPKHSIFFAWKEIIRHWRLLYQISLLNAKCKGLSLMGTKQGLEMIKEHKRHSKMLSLS